MRTIILNIGITVFLLFTVWQAKGQEYLEFAPVGAEWYYTYTHTNPLESCTKYSVEKDTLIDESLCKMVICSFRYNSNYNDYNNLDTIIFKQEGGKIYYYFKEQFNLIYDYDVQALEEVTFTFMKDNMDSVSLVPVKCTVKEVQQIEINGRQYKQFFTAIDTSFDDAWFHFHDYVYIEQIGHPYVFMEKLRTVINMAEHTVELRCYIEDAFHYITPWWQKYDLPCDTLVHYNVPDNIISMEMNMVPVVVYPNPAHGALHLNMENTEMVNIQQVGVYDIYGKQLRKIENIGVQRTTVNLSGLANGIYFIRVFMDNGKTKIKRIVKE
ncbi:MAG: T9SS type A sorting domain-containing protein [Bacteroidales bacterium]|jgi:hypothetical protein|nr:T9SS type A sorting domain-containing protein [Bacteroidales bacterium]